jgi:hypothetical protein
VTVPLAGSATGSLGGREPCGHRVRVPAAVLVCGLGLVLLAD